MSHLPVTSNMASPIDLWLQSSGSPKRKRASKEQPSDCNSNQEDSTSQQQPTPPPSRQAPAELTTENLLLHTQLGDPSATVIMPAPSGTEKTATAKSRLEDEQALRNFGIRFKTKASPPSGLLAHIRDVVQMVRGEESPNAKELAEIHPSTSSANEATVVIRVVPLLLFNDKLLDRINGEHHIVRKHDLNFEAQWVTKGKFKLATPRPDVSIGYILDMETCNRTSSLFNEDEERALLSFAVNKEILAPFITCQMKSACGDMPTADIQITRDAVAILNAAFALLDAAGEVPTVEDLHHWSVTCNGTMAHLWLHWAIVEPVFGLRHYMK